MVKLSGFQVQEQKTPYTCGYSSLSMVSHYLGNGVEEEELEKELPIGTLGTYHSKKLLNCYHFVITIKKTQ